MSKEYKEPTIEQFTDVIRSVLLRPVEQRKVYENKRPSKEELETRYRMSTTGDME